MDEKMLLKEIAYYSKIVNKYQMSSGTTKTFTKAPTALAPSNYTYYSNKTLKNDDKNKYVYVKTDVSVVNHREPTKTSQKVLINPNFKHSVHINPNFKPATDTVKAHEVHVNPNRLLKGIIQSRAVTNEEFEVPEIVHEPSGTINKTVIKQSNINVEPSNLICSRYKVIKKVDTARQSTKYKVDRRVATSRRRLLSNRSLNLSVKSKYVYLNHGGSNAPYVCFNKRLIKKSNSAAIAVKGVKLKAGKKWTHKANSHGSPNKKLVLINGQMYNINGNKKTLKIVRKGGNATSDNLKCKLLVKVHSPKRRFILQAKQRSISTLINKMHKNNMPCLLYRKFGRCKGKERGTCKKVHNTNEIALCQKFLQGACVKEKCLLSHKVSSEKMPTCRFYLEGMCVKENCPYLHVKINANAEICKDFLEGFCRDAEKCEKRHQYLCPDFEKLGVCKKTKCRYPHGKLGIRHQKTKVKTTEVLVSIIDTNPPSDSIPESARYYYTDTINNTIRLDDAIDSVSILNNSSVVVNSDAISDFDNVASFKKRAQLGDLPCFIPFISP